MTLSLSLSLHLNEYQALSKSNQLVATED